MLIILLVHCFIGYSRAAPLRMRKSSQFNQRGLKIIILLLLTALFFSNRLRKSAIFLTRESKRSQALAESQLVMQLLNQSWKEKRKKEKMMASSKVMGSLPAQR